MDSSMKSAVVTGAGTGIGKAAAVALLQNGYRVAFAGRRREPLEQAIAQAGANASRGIASRTVGRLTPKSSASSRSDGNLSPGP